MGLSIVGLLLLPATGLGAAQRPLADVPALSLTIGHPMPPVIGGHHPRGLQIPHPAGSQAGVVWYTQVGATLQQLNGTDLVTGAATLTVTVPLVSSPYPIGYELNGVTNSGDWYQILVGDNWPSCPGYEMLYEVWDNSGVGQPPGCDTTVTMLTGDLIQLGLNFTPSHAVCLDLTDLTRGHSHSICQAQPNSGGNRFVTLFSSADANGYFTGPMTEIANTSALACPDYTHMPAVNFEWMKGLFVTGMIPWSDEFELGGSSLYCYGGGGNLDTFFPGDPATYATDTASGTPYGPHWVSGQNFSMVNGAYDFRVQTDIIPPTSVSLTGLPTTISLGGHANLTGAVAGGVAPYTALWSINSTIIANGSLTRTFVGSAGGVYVFRVFGVDARMDVVGPSNAVTITVTAPLGVPAVNVATPSHGADVGQLVALNAIVSGGIPGYSYQWTGLPNECPGVSSPTIWCTPITAATYNVTVTVHDQNGTTKTSVGTMFIVSPALTASVALSGTEVDLNQSFQATLSFTGGSGAGSVGWAGLPTGCPGGNISRFVCTPTQAGLFPISGSVTDRNGFTAASAATMFKVHPQLTASFTIGRIELDAGVNVSYAARVAGGAGNFTYAWQGVPAGCVPANRSSFSCAATSAGTFAVSLTVSDPLGATAKTGPTVILVHPALSVLLSGAPVGYVGSTITVTAALAGGAGHPSFRWAGLPDGCGVPATQNFSCSSAQAGSYTLTLTVTDSAGGGVTASFNLTVEEATATPSNVPGWAYLAVLAAALIAVAALGAVAYRRRGPSD